MRTGRTGTGGESAVRKYVGNLVSEAFPIISGLSRKGLPRRDPYGIDSLDQKWFCERVVAQIPLAEKMELCFRILEAGIPPWYSRPFSRFLAGLVPMATDTEQDLPDAVTRSADALIGKFPRALGTRGELPIPVLEAVQGLVDDLFDGYFSKKDRQRISLAGLKRKVPTPMAHFTEGLSPFTQGSYRFREVSFEVCLVGYPAWMAKGGVALWAALAHETCGHAFLNAHPELSVELREGIRFALWKGLRARDGRRYSLRDQAQISLYWEYRFEEALSDCLGCLALGPALAYGLLARLEIEKRAGVHGEAPDAHPSTFLRCYLAACMVGELEFKEAPGLKRNLIRHLQSMRQSMDVGAWEFSDLGISLISPEDQEWAATGSAALFARTVAKAALACMEEQPLGSLQNWRDGDEAISRSVSGLLTMGETDFASAWGEHQSGRAGAYPIHVVAGSIHALGDSPGDRSGGIFRRMIEAINTHRPVNDYLSEFSGRPTGTRSSVARARGFAKS